MAEIGLIEARRPRAVFFWRPEQLGRMTSILQLQGPGIVQLQYLRNRCGGSALPVGVERGAAVFVVRSRLGMRIAVFVIALRALKRSLCMLSELLNEAD